jgi:hypothetical protein
MPTTLEEIARQLTEVQTSLKNMEQDVAKVKHRLFVYSAYSWLKFLLIAASLVLGWWYITPYTEDLMKQWQAIQSQMNSFRQVPTTGVNQQMIQDFLKKQGSQ